MAYASKPRPHVPVRKPFVKRQTVEDKEKKGLGITPKGATRTKLTFGVTPKDVKQARQKRTPTQSQLSKAKGKRSEAAKKMTDVEAGVSQAVRKRETGTASPYTPKAPQWKTILKKLLASKNLPKGTTGRAIEIINNSDNRTEAERLIDKMSTKPLKGRPSSNARTVMAMSKKGGTVSRKGGGTVKKQVGGLPQGYNARLDESLAARHPAVRGNLAARRAESMGMERALGRRPYSGARTMAKKGGSVSRKKGGTASRKGGGKIMVGYKAGGKV